MIKSISIKNIALIDSLDIEFGEGMNVMSGETGAGKSIIIDSLNFVLGDRADRSLIRHGEKFASVEAVFDVFGNTAIENCLKEMGFEVDDILIVSRNLSENGRNECRINRKVANLSSLKELVSLLVDIHSQHEHQSLLNVQNHIKILDAYAKCIAAKKDEYTLARATYLNIIKDMSSFSDSAERERQIDLLKFQIDEIKKYMPEEGEEERLLAMRSKLNNMERILTSASSAITALDGETSSAMYGVASAIAHLQQVEQYDERFSGLLSRLDGVKIEISDVVDTVKACADFEDFDGTGLEQIEKRIREIRDLRRKYGSSVGEISAYLEKAETEFARLTNAEDRISELTVLRDRAAKTLRDVAKQLHDVRVSCSVEFSKKILANIRQLGMKDSEFEVNITLAADVDSYGVDGGDSVEFLISPNKGEPLKPLQKIASGGELSRFMLALKTIIADLDNIDTLIFDEIDTGISGNVAKVVAEKLSQISKDRQVVVVTHLAQIAAMADHQYLIEKSSDDVKTTTHVSLLDADDMVSELIRLTGGQNDSAASIAHAKELKEWAEKFKTTR